ncbi:MAG: phosphate ABC transporter substrate-binding protein PstS, partial [Brachymonas sp.]|nr:phosphate ABC transporter substrate-binding protein PstS [Brachymonas sp.]
PGADAWPITAATYIMMHTKQDKPETAAQVLKFFDWIYANGDAGASGLDYVAMPADVKTVIQQSWANIQDGAGNPIAYK